MRNLLAPCYKNEAYPLLETKVQPVSNNNSNNNSNSNNNNNSNSNNNNINNKNNNNNNKNNLSKVGREA